MDAISFIEESQKEVKELTLNASWRKILPEFVPAKTKSRRQEIQEAVRDIVSSARTIDGEGFEDMQECEITEVTSSTADLSTEEVEELATPLPLEPETNEIENPIFDGKTIVEIINSLKNAVELAIDRDLIMTRSLHFKHNCEKAVDIYEQLYKDVMRRTRQSRVTDFFMKK